MSWLCPWCWYTSLCSSVHGADLLLHCCCSVQGADSFSFTGTLSMVLTSFFRMDSVHGADSFVLTGTLYMVLISTVPQLWCGADLPPTVHEADGLIVFSECDGFLYFCFSGKDFYNTAAAWTCWWLEHYQNPFIMLHDADFNKSIALSVVLKFSPIIKPTLLHSTACV